MESKDVITETSDKPAGYFKLMEVEEVNWIPMENGNLYTGDLYLKNLKILS